MSSLLEGIDVAEKGAGKKSSGGGPNPKLIKGAVAAALFLVAGAIFAIQLDLIPNPFGTKAPKNSRGNAIEFKPTPPEELEKQRKILEQQTEEHIRKGGSVGSS